MHKSDAVSSCDVGTLDSLENPVDVKTSDILEDCSDVLLPEEEPPTVFNTPTIERDELYEKFKSKILVNAALDRSLVSNQANKKLSFYSWFSYKEGFSEPFVSYILGHLIQHPKTGILLDPFSGSGSALFAASAKGWQTKGIELLPVGNFATNMRFIAERVDAHKVGAAIADLLQIDDFTRYYSPDNAIKHITITSGAFPQLEEQQLVGYISYCKNYILDEYIRELLLYGGMDNTCVGMLVLGVLRGKTLLIKGKFTHFVQQ